MRIPTLSGVMSGNGQTTGDEEIVMKEEEINNKANIFKPDGTKEKAKIMELQQELFTVKQFGGNNEDSNRESGMGYMLGLSGQKKSPGGLAYMLGDGNKKSKTDKFDMFGMGNNKKQNNFDMFGMGGKNKTNDFFGGKMKQNNSMVTKMLGRQGIKRVNPNMINEYLNMGGKKNNATKQIAPKTNQNVAKINSFLNMGKSMQSTDNKIKNMLGSNLMGAMNKQERAMSGMHQNPVESAIGRVNMQNKLNMFGDFDKDGVSNILDCNPMNPNEQAWYHDFGRALKSGAAATGRFLGGDWAAGPDPAGATIASQTMPIPPSESKFMTIKSVSAPEPLYSYSTTVETPKQPFMQGLQNVGAGLNEAGFKTPGILEGGKVVSGKIKEGAVSGAKGVQQGVATYFGGGELTSAQIQKPTTLREQLLQEQILAARQKRMIPTGRTGQSYGGLGAAGGMVRNVRGVAGAFPGVSEFGAKAAGSFGGVGIDASIGRIKQMSDIGGQGLGFYETTATMAETLGEGGGFSTMMGQEKMTGKGFNAAMGIEEPEIITEKVEEEIVPTIPEQIAVEQPQAVEDIITQQQETRPQFYERIRQIRQLATSQPQHIPVAQPQYRQQPIPVAQPQYPQQPMQPLLQQKPKVIGAGGKLVSYTRKPYRKRQNY